MSKPIPVQAEMEALCGLLLEGTITDEQCQRLEDLVLTDPIAKRTYIECISLHSALYRYNAANMAGTIESELYEIDETNEQTKTSEKTQSPVLGFLGNCLQQGASFLFKSNVFSLLVALGLPGLVLVFLVFGLVSQPESEDSVAIVKALHRCEGYAGDNHSLCPLYPGMALYRGQQLTLSEGLVEVEFSHGAQAVLQGPTTFDIRNGNAGFLRVGRLTAQVPPRAKGFVVATPSAQVVDLGTDFGVSVAVDGTAEAHVFKGKVNVTTRTTAETPVASTTCLKTGQAARICVAKSGKTPKVVAMTATPKRFVRHLPVSPNPRPRVLFAHYGNADPVAEGWRLEACNSRNLRLDVKTDPSCMKPVNDAGTAAWMLDNHALKNEIRYSMSIGHGFRRETMDEARSNGWIMRARIRLDDVGQGTKSICHLIYHDKEYSWGLFPEIRLNGELFLIVNGQSSRGPNANIPIPNGRNRYVNYEVRYNPATNDADVFVDGHCVATGFKKSTRDRSPDAMVAGIQFGLQGRLSKARFAMVEFEVLGAPTPSEQ